MTEASVVATTADVADALFAAGWLGAVLLDRDLVVRSLHGAARDMGPIGAPIDRAMPILAGYEAQLRAAADGAAFFLPNVALIEDSETPAPRYTIRALPVRDGLLLSLERNPALVALQREVMQARNDLMSVRRDLERRERRLAQANAWLDQFAAAISHDLKAPMRAIANCAPFLAKDLAAGDAEAASDWIADIEREARRGLRMADDLLAVARLNEAGADEADVDMWALVRELAQSLAAEPGRVVETRGASPILRVNPALMRQILQNLIANGLKYNRSTPRRVVVSAERAADAVRIVAADNGVGVPDGEKDAIFTLFRRAHGEDDGFEGSGVGLALARSAAARIGGGVHVEDGVGGGSRFIVTLPVSALAIHAG